MNDFLHRSAPQTDPMFTLAAENASVNPLQYQPCHQRRGHIKLPNGKAPGICNTTAEMLKIGSDQTINWLTHIIDQV